MGGVIKPTLPKGTRDYSTSVMLKRNYLIGTIKEIYRKFGYAPIQTPAMENLETLTGKYGDEGDRLIFKILNSGDYLSKADELALGAKDSTKLTSSISKKALRYDLTVPLARYIVQHQNEISFPFKRYQIQPVWRADRPQKGRYQEFYQCDADVIGSESLLNDAELLQIIAEVFSSLSLKVQVKINNRKILKGISEVFNFEQHFNEFTVIIDKIDKIGGEKVIAELKEKGLEEEYAKQLTNLFNSESIESTRANLVPLLRSSEIGRQGLDEIDKVLDLLGQLNINMHLFQLDPLLARGLDYYTGTIIEVIAPDSGIGSICGGGRYDNLTGIFGLDNMSGIGISFGIDRIFDVMIEQNLFPDSTNTSTDVLFVNFGPEEVMYLLPYLNEVRNEGISAILYPDSTKLKKQFKYADDNGVKWVAIAGSEEIKSKTITVKNMIDGNQSTISFQELIRMIKDE